MGKGFTSLGLVVALNWVDFIVGVILHVGIPLALILMILQIEEGNAPRGILHVNRKFFWSFFRQELAGLFLTLLYSFPFLFLVLYSIALENTPFYLTVYPLWLFISGFLGLGSVSLGHEFFSTVEMGRSKTRFREFVC